jgi:hypothetical protein
LRCKSGHTVGVLGIEEGNEHLKSLHRAVGGIGSWKCKRDNGANVWAAGELTAEWGVDASCDGAESFGGIKALVFGASNREELSEGRDQALRGEDVACVLIADAEPLIGANKAGEEVNGAVVANGASKGTNEVGAPAEELNDLAVATGKDRAECRGEATCHGWVETVGVREAEEVK